MMEKHVCCGLFTCRNKKEMPLNRLRTFQRHFKNISLYFKNITFHYFSLKFVIFHRIVLCFIELCYVSSNFIIFHISLLQFIAFSSPHPSHAVCAIGW